MVAGPAAEATAASSAEPTPAADPAILNTTWTATRIGDTRRRRQLPPTLALVSNHRAGGSGGCNSWYAVVELDADTLHFGDVAANKKSCGADRDTAEQAFFAALALRRQLEIEADDLTLFGADGAPLAFSH